ncbi:hypothetical protein PVK06_048466 [Gossypium arboreum]|uniref:Zinc finger MYM-type protein 1-like n=1 Tax=Gossypium arboreum TaxID=29729 RepID=A0ABR0MIQ6_GOSAR|nr:hypothetical protein PVK06_048466 [Gossypium arboreum]
MLALEKAISEILLCHFLNFDNIRGQLYDGARNMRGEWNDLQALFAKKCQFAYYIHYLSHRLQLTLVNASNKSNIVELIDSGELETSKGKNQVGTLQRLGDT